MTTSKRTTPKRTTTRRRTSTTATRRRRKTPTVAAGVGTAVGTLVVAALLKLSWPARIGLVVAVLVLAVGYLLWRNRTEIRAGATDPTGETTPAPTHDPEGPT